MSAYLIVAEASNIDLPLYESQRSEPYASNQVELLPGKYLIRSMPSQSEGRYIYADVRLSDGTKDTQALDIYGTDCGIQNKHHLNIDQLKGASIVMAQPASNEFSP